MRFSITMTPFLLAGILFFSNAFANSTNTQFPITIEADRAELDEKKEISAYTGSVILRQGGITIEADKLFVYAKNGELQRITAEGNPIKYTQQREGEEDISGSSMHMEYEAETKRFILINNAVLIQGKNRFSGERIQFDPDKEKVIATGSTSDTGEKSQRVQITIQPQSGNKKP